MQSITFDYEIVFENEKVANGRRFKKIVTWF